MSDHNHQTNLDAKAFSELIASQKDVELKDASYEYENPEMTKEQQEAFFEECQQANDIPNLTNQQRDIATCESCPMSPEEEKEFFKSWSIPEDSLHAQALKTEPPRQEPVVLDAKGLWDFITDPKNQSDEPASFEYKDPDMPLEELAARLTKINGLDSDEELDEEEQPFVDPISDDIYNLDWSVSDEELQKMFRRERERTRFPDRMIADKPDKST